MTRRPRIVRIVQVADVLAGTAVVAHRRSVVLAEATQRSKSFLAAEAIRSYVEINEWQIGEIQAALVEANAGDFASGKDVAAVARKRKVNAA